MSNESKDKKTPIANPRIVRETITTLPIENVRPGFLGGFRAIKIRKAWVEVKEEKNG